MHLMPYITKLINEKFISIDDVRVLTPKYAMLIVDKHQLIIKRATVNKVTDTLVMTDKSKSLIAVGDKQICKFIKVLHKQNK